MELYSYATSPGTYIFSATHQHVPKGENSLPMVSILVNDLLDNKTPFPVFKVHEVVKKTEKNRETFQKAKNNKKITKRKLQKWGSKGIKFLNSKEKLCFFLRLTNLGG